MVCGRTPPHKAACPIADGYLKLEVAIRHRRSVRDFGGTALSALHLGQVLWAAQGVMSPAGQRAAPSAGALYPLTLYAVVGNVTELDAGSYLYQPQEHVLIPVREGDLRQRLAAAALAQDWVADAAAIIAIGAVYERTTGKYGARGERYAHIEVGHAAQNACLQAVAVGLGMTQVGAFRDEAVREVVGMSDEERPLSLLPMGAPLDAALK